MPKPDRELQRALEESARRGQRAGQRRGILRVLSALAADIIRRETSEVVAELLTAGPGAAIRLALGSRESWASRWRSTLTPALQESARSATEDAAPELGELDFANPKMAQAFEDYVIPLSEEVAGTSAEDLTGVIREAQSRGLSVPDTAARLRERGEELSRRRSLVISRTELLRSANLATRLQFEESGVVGSITWTATNDERTRSSHRRVDGETVPLGERFSNGLLQPGDGTAGKPEEVIQCRCTITGNLR